MVFSEDISLSQHAKENINKRDVEWTIAVDAAKSGA
jgi:hypothetical protein